MSYYRHGPGRPSGPGMSIGIPPLTPMVRAIMVACGVVWLLEFVFIHVFQLPEVVKVLGLVPARTLRGYLWQPFTYMWLHSPVYLMHLGINLLVLWMFGGDLERRWGSRGFLRYYLICGVGAGVFIFVGGLFSPASYDVPTIGASGAIFGVIVAYGMVFSERIVLFMMIFPMKARTLSWIFLAIELIATVSHGSGGVSSVAHLGGMVVGYLYLKRAWRLREFAREIRWKIHRRRFRVLPPDDDENRWIH